MTYFDRNIKEMRAKLHMTQDEFSLLIGASRGAIAQYELGKNKPKTYVTMRLCKISNITPDELFNTEIDFNKIVFNIPESRKAKDIDALIFSEKQSSEGIPYLGELDIFAGQTDIAHADLSEYITEFISIPGFKDANYFVNVRGSSMYPKYVPGEIIAIKLVKDMNEIQYGQAYVVITAENRVLKYVRKAKNGNTNLILASANNDYDPYEVERKNVKAMFLVLGKISKDVL